MALSLLMASKHIINKHNFILKRIIQIDHTFKQNSKIIKNGYFVHKGKDVKIFPRLEIFSINVQPQDDRKISSQLIESLTGLNVRCTEIYVKKRRYRNGSRHYSTSSHPKTDTTPPLPSIIYLQNPFTWIVNKFDLKILQKAWDPAFDNAEFIKGTKQAMSTVMELVTKHKNQELQGLLTRAARSSLEVDLSQPGVERLLPMMGLSPSNIKVAAPRRVRFLKYEDRKFCDVDMMFVALKWVSSERNDGLIYLELFASFRREYTKHSIPEWTIAYFKIIKFKILDR